MRKGSNELRRGGVSRPRLVDGLRSQFLRLTAVAVLVLIQGAGFAKEAPHIDVKMLFEPAALENIKPTEFEAFFKDLLSKKLQTAWPGVSVVSARGSKNVVTIRITNVDMPGFLHNVATGLSLGIIMGTYEMTGTVSVAPRDKTKSVDREVQATIFEYCLPFNSIGTCNQRYSKMVDLFADKVALIVASSM